MIPLRNINYDSKFQSEKNIFYNSQPLKNIGQYSNMVRLDTSPIKEYD